jgi:VCBS repeat-containing protein
MRTTAASNLLIVIEDDEPTAGNDAENLSATEMSTDGNVLDGTGTTTGTTGADVRGADGGLHVVGIALGSGPTVAVGASGTTQITGAHGTLTIDANGNYSYTRTSSGQDVFTYSVQDADGSSSTATLTIDVENATPGGIEVPEPDRGETAVFETGLPARGTEPAGSNPAAPTTTEIGTIRFTSLDGVSKIELGGLVLTAADVQQSFTDATGTLTASFIYDAATGLGEITYTYTLLDNTLGDPSSVSFEVAVTDADGDRTVAANDLVIAITDDEPTAFFDTDAVVANQTTPETGNVLDGSGTMSGDSGVDILGADGATVVRIAFGSTVVRPLRAPSARSRFLPTAPTATSGLQVAAPISSPIRSRTAMAMSRRRS